MFVYYVSFFVPVFSSQYTYYIYRKVVMTDITYVFVEKNPSLWTYHVNERTNRMGLDSQSGLNFFRFFFFLIRTSSDMFMVSKKQVDGLSRTSHYCVLS